MPIELKFSLNQLQDLDNDLTASSKGIYTVIQKVMVAQFKQLRSELRSFIPRQSGRLQRSFGYSVRKPRPSVVTARLGFMTGRRVSASTAIAANVLQGAGASPRKGKYLWIPLPDNRSADGAAITTPRQLLAAGGFVATSRAGNRIAFQKRSVEEHLADRIEIGRRDTERKTSRRGGIPAFVLKTFVKIGPPVPLEARVESQLPEITDDIEQTIGAVIEARRAVVEANVL